jgi:hypothetical protein
VSRDTAHILPATAEHAEALAPIMRQKDRDEVWALAHRTPLEALTLGLEQSESPQTGFYGPKILCMMGIARQGLVTGIGVPWFLSSVHVEEHPRAFLRSCKRYFSYWSQDYDFLVNYVDARYTEAVEWVRWLGFEVHPAERVGKDNLPFHRIELRK